MFSRPLAKAFTDQPVKFLDRLCAVFAADKRALGCMDDDEIVAANGSYQVFWIVGGDQRTMRVQQQRALGRNRVALLVFWACLGKRRPRTDIEPL